MELSGEAVEAVAELAQKAQNGQEKVLTIGGVEYSSIPVHDVRKPDQQPKAFILATLSGLAAFIKRNVDDLSLDKVIVHVAGHDVVRFHGPLYGDFEQRDTFAEAQCPNRFAGATNFAFGKYMTPESLIVALQALFEDGFDRPSVLALLGNIKDEFVKSTQDDGVSQTVSAKDGIVLLSERKVPNPVNLAPFRTFDEVEQPVSRFVLRLKKDADSVVYAALFEADGGAWRTEAIRRIAKKLEELLGATEITIVA